MNLQPERSIIWGHEPSLASTVFRGRLRRTAYRSPLVVAAAVAAALAGHASLAAQGTQTANLNVSANVVRNCTIQTDQIAFGDYDALAGAALDKQGAIKLTCTKGTVATITLDNGRTPQTGQRAMAGGNPAGFLKYELYFGSYGGTRWGTSGGETFTAAAAPDNTERSFTIYGRILGSQASVSQGAYTDVVLATVNF